MPTRTSKKGVVVGALRQAASGICCTDSLKGSVTSSDVILMEPNATERIEGFEKSPEAPVKLYGVRHGHKKLRARKSKGVPAFIRRLQQAIKSSAESELHFP